MVHKLVSCPLVAWILPNLGYIGLSMHAMHHLFFTLQALEFCLGIQILFQSRFWNLKHMVSCIAMHYGRAG